MELRNPLIFCFCFIFPPCFSDLSSHFVLEPYDFLFDSAVEAYYKGDWLSVILNMEKALRNKATVRKVKTQCRLGCANQTAFGDQLAGTGDPVPGSGSLADLGFFQKILRRADCVKTCESEKLGSPTLHEVTEDVELEFRKRTPYNYLQVAYFKINKLDKAVAAAHTFFQANPDHVEMRQNLDYYKMMAGVEEGHFKDLEAREHMAEFLLGKRFYSNDSFEQAAEHFEVAVREFFTSNQECRVLCEGAYNYDGYNYMEYSADLFQTITDHYMQVLSCKQRCALELATNTDQPFDDFLPSHFNYLQFSYYNSENLEQAIECAKTFLLFYPDDEVMKDNLAYYSVMLGEDKAQTISPRQVVKRYIQQSMLEKELLYFGYEAFGITFVDPDKWTPEEIMPKKLRDKQKADRETAARITEEIGNLMKEIETLVEEKKKDSSDVAKMVAPQPGVPQVQEDDIRVSMTDKQLNGSQRVLLDKVISEDECRELQRLSNAAALKGDGYRGTPSPHSPGEMFQGVTVLKALKLGQEGKVPLKSARAFFDVSEKARRILELYFQLKTPLYFSYSHLVCRSAIDEKQEARTDLSHPVHADNCLLVSEMNECIKEPPAYTHRDYSAILYLNDDFEGGDFIFTKLDAKTVTAEIRPQCGRMVGFGAGKENPHGVRAVTKGQRCAVALWFTLDPAHEEKERIQAQEMLKMFSAPVNQEFIKNEVAETSETHSATSESAGQARTEEKQEEKPEEKQPDAAAAAVQEDKSSKVKAGEKSTKAAPKAKSKGQASAKLKAKTKTKKTDKKDSKSAAKKTVKVATKSSKAGSGTVSGSQDGKEEL